MAIALPALSIIPTLFESIEHQALAMEQVVETHLKSLSVAGLKKLADELSGGVALPFGLEPYRAKVEAFLSDAIVLVQLAAQLGLIAAVPVQPAA